MTIYSSGCVKFHPTQSKRLKHCSCWILILYFCKKRANMIANRTSTISVAIAIVIVISEGIPGKFCQGILGAFSNTFLWNAWGNFWTRNYLNKHLKESLEYFFKESPEKKSEVAEGIFEIRLIYGTPWWNSLRNAWKTVWRNFWIPCKGIHKFIW